MINAARFLEINAPIPGDVMRAFGSIAAGLGALIMAFSFAIEVSVGGGYDDNRVVNLLLLSNREMVFFIGAAAFLAGTVLACAGIIVRTLVLSALQGALHEREATRAKDASASGEPDTSGLEY
jgi:hypothetical protein